MSLPREQKKSQIPWLDLGLFAGVLAFLGYSLHAFFGARTPARAPASAIEPAAPLPPSERATPSPAIQGSTEILRVPCLHEGSRVFTTSARLLQIHSVLCSGDDKSAAAQWRATNESSGEEILVFVNHKEKNLSTSYFSLKEGRNDLVFVEERGGKGRAHTEKLQVTRLVN